MKIFNLFRMDPTNAGDWQSPPFRYFPELGDACIEVNSSTTPKERSIIVMGGGGLISPKPAFQKLQRFLGKHHCVGWGLGENWYDAKNLGYFPPQPQTFPDYLDRFDLLGIRDATEKHRQVPCASCMHPAFDETHTVKRHIGFYLHKRIPLASAGHDICSNDGASLEDKLKFIGESEVIVTNSYHGAYWAMLLNRRVLCVPFGSKFYGFGEPLDFRAPWDLRLDDLGELPLHPGYLERCREANHNFHTAFLDSIRGL